MLRNLTCCYVVAVILTLLAAPGQAQVVREQGVNSIAGILHKVAGIWQSDEFIFQSFGDEILVGDLDAELFMNPAGEGGGCGETTLMTAGATGGGCDCGGDEGDSGGGQGQFILTVLDSSGNAICQAGRPTRPGWERDPRIACHLELAGEYRLQVGRGHMGGEMTVATGAMETGPTKVVYLLNVSLRKVATSGPMIPSIAVGRNLFPKQN